MNTLDPWQELIKGLQLAEEEEKRKQQIVKQFRLYYNDDGSIIGMWESGYPDGDNYVVIDHPDIFNKANTQLLKVVDKKLVKIDPRDKKVRQLYKSNSGQPVVQGHAAIALGIDEEYLNIEFYDRKNS